MNRPCYMLSQHLITTRKIFCLICLRLRILVNSTDEKASLTRQSVRGHQEHQAQKGDKMSFRSQLGLCQGWQKLFLQKNVLCIRSENKNPRNTNYFSNRLSIIMWCNVLVSSLQIKPNSRSIPILNATLLSSMCLRNCTIAFVSQQEQLEISQSQCHNNF